jgi:hypothetical protein
MNRARNIKCPACASEWGRLYRQANPERGRQYRLAHREMFATGKLQWLERNPLKKRAHIITTNAIHAGKLIKPSHCEQCDTVRVEAHHDDYSKPLEIRWLCLVCHKRADRERREREQEGRFQVA